MYNRRSRNYIRIIPAADRGQDMIRELIMKNRSYRRFHQDIAIDMDKLRYLVDLTRYTASATNKQPLKYMLFNTSEKNALIFPCLGWAGYLKNWPGPEEGEKPSAYIVILGDRDITESFGCDHGIAAQTILLGAIEMGFGGCMLGNVNRKQLKSNLSISPRYDVLLVIALGKPKETVVIETMAPDGDIKYWRDSSQIHHVPKRRLEDIIIV
jgi:nitroreductase